jgi:hypothetical protein
MNRHFDARFSINRKEIQAAMNAQKPFCKLRDAAKITGLRPELISFWHSKYGLLSSGRPSKGRQRYYKKPDLVRLLIVKNLLREGEESGDQERWVKLANTMTLVPYRDWPRFWIVSLRDGGVVGCESLPSASLFVKGAPRRKSVGAETSVFLVISRQVIEEELADAVEDMLEKEILPATMIVSEE